MKLSVDWVLPVKMEDVIQDNKNRENEKERRSSSEGVPGIAFLPGIGVQDASLGKVLLCSGLIDQDRSCLTGCPLARKSLSGRFMGRFVTVHWYHLLCL